MVLLLALPPIKRCAVYEPSSQLVLHSITHISYLLAVSQVQIKVISSDGITGSGVCMQEVVENIIHSIF
jgi:hypothetical protein